MRAQPSGELGGRAHRQSQTAPDARPQLTDLRSPWAVVSSEQWALICQIDGRATITDLAWRNDFALYETMEWIEDLIRVGLCVIAADAGHSGTELPDYKEPPDDDEGVPLPRRAPGASLAARSAKAKAPVVPQWRPADIQKPPDTSHSDLLRRILSGLRRADGK